MTASPTTLENLLIQETQADILAAALLIATQIGLPTSSWQTGDPTRSMYMLEAQELAAWDAVITGYIQSGFLDYAALPTASGGTNPWLAILAQQVFGVTVPPATFATTTETLTNNQGGLYVVEPGDLTFTCSANPGATFTNTTGCTLTPTGTPGATQTVTVVAATAGSANSAGAGEIDTLVTTLEGVTCTNVTAAVGLDQQSAAATVAQCRAKLGSLSPNGPASAYEYVALNSALTNDVNITRCRVYPDSETGDVTIYIAGASTLSSSDVTAAQNAINQWATPLCITPTVVAATGVTINVTYTIWIYQSVNQSSSQIQAAIQTALEDMFAEVDIGGDIIPPASTGDLYQSRIWSTIGGVFPAQTFRVQLSSPSSDTALTNGQVPVLGTVTGTVNIIPGP